MSSWKKSIVPLFLFLLLTGSALTAKAAVEAPNQEIAIAAVDTGEPRAEIPETLFDFGEMKEGEEYVHAFIICNVGTAILEIKKILPG